MCYSYSITYDAIGNPLSYWNGTLTWEGRQLKTLTAGNTVSVTKLNGTVIPQSATEIAYLNPIRYRGYYFDQESGLYYLKSRYYDPRVRRFLNPDSIIFTPGVVNHNIFTYCNNNPVNMIDSNGRLAGIIGGLLLLGCMAIAGIAAIAVVSNGQGGTLPGISGPYGDINGFRDPFPDLPADPFSAPDDYVPALEKDIAPAIPKVKDKERMKPTFPADPNAFTPKGLIPNDRPGTKNGKFIGWNSPSKVEIFRWDENPHYDNGPHYHVKGYFNPDKHFYAGDPIPEPWATQYFGGK